MLLRENEVNIGCDFVDITFASNQKSHGSVPGFVTVRDRATGVSLLDAQRCFTSFSIFGRFLGAAGSVILVCSNVLTVSLSQTLDVSLTESLTLTQTLALALTRDLNPLKDPCSP